MIQKLANRKYYCVAEIPESQQELASSSCRICQSLAILKSDGSRTFLHALSAGWLFKGLTAPRLSKLKLTDTVLLRLDSRREKKETKIDKVMGSLIAVEPTKSTSEPFSSLLPSQPWPRTIKYEQIKSWITYCNENHDDTCTSKEKTQLQPFKVIDCISYQSGEPIKPVSLPTNQEYAALSYLWGEDDKKQSGVSESMAPVINDSIGIWAALRFTDNITAYSFFYLDHESLAEKKDFSLPAMILESGTSSKEKNTIILVLQEGKGYYQRAGLIRMASVTSPEAKDSGRENDVQPTVYKDASGCWSRNAPTCEMKKWVWLQAAEDRTFQVW
ncbi:hypothetical protein BFJ63_vAg18667 [Fusarium oxysporum f. sp. narcissi]|uniref:Heterokaryon incompatibility domain-containing protein n=1 Tax=Fusarium oxysporum f. sp. narcissi TaxID=451672 RepID=A0A4Q2V3R1_FUSOX|nr:hypothetical protein BFJ63_vAg18667 [Fusarium oxysporum f. sp. narcissi]